MASQPQKLRRIGHVQEEAFCREIVWPRLGFRVSACVCWAPPASVEFLESSMGIKRIHLPNPAQTLLLTRMTSGRGLAVVDTFLRT